MPKFNCWTILGLINVSIIFGMSISDVGVVPDCSEEPYTWYMPIQILIAFLAPFIFGYLGGKDKESDEK